MIMDDRMQCVRGFSSEDLVETKIMRNFALRNLRNAICVTILIS